MMFGADFALEVCSLRAIERHAETLHERDCGEVACVDDCFDPFDSVAREREVDCRAACFGRETLSLYGRREREPDLRIRARRVRAESNVADEVIGVSVRNRDLEPLVVFRLRVPWL